MYLGNTKFWQNNDNPSKVQEPTLLKFAIDKRDIKVVETLLNNKKTQISYEQNALIYTSSDSIKSSILERFPRLLIDKSRLLSLAKKLDEPGILTDILGKDAFKLFTEKELRSAKRGANFVASVDKFINERLNTVTADGKNIDNELSNALNHNNLPRVRQLINDGAWVNSTNPKTGSDLLAIPVFRNDFETTKLLLAKGASANALVGAKDSSYFEDWSALSLAALDKRYDIVELLLQNGAKVKYGKVNVTNRAIQRQDIKMINLLLKYKAADPNHLLQEGLDDTNAKIFEVALINGADPKTLDFDLFSMDTKRDRKIHNMIDTYNSIGNKTKENIKGTLANLRDGKSFEEAFINNELYK